jgi:hypothetical protein
MYKNVHIYVWKINAPPEKTSWVVAIGNTLVFVILIILWLLPGRPVPRS